LFLHLFLFFSFLPISFSSIYPKSIITRNGLVIGGAVIFVFSFFTMCFIKAPLRFLPFFLPIGTHKGSFPLFDL